MEEELTTVQVVKDNSPKKITLDKIISYFTFFLILLGSIAIICTAFINASKGVEALNWVVAVLVCIGSIFGILSIYFSNKKSLWFAFFGIMGVLLKLSYPIFEIISKKDTVKTTEFINQGFNIVIGIFQLWYWRKLNQDSSIDKFFTKNFKKKNAIKIVLMFVAFFTCWWMLTWQTTPNSIEIAFLESVGGFSLIVGSILMMIGNIWCFFFFFIGDVFWIGWTIDGILKSEPNSIDKIIEISLLIQSIVFTCLVIIGAYEWKKDLQK